MRRRDPGGEWRGPISEGIGTAFLLATIVGSGVMGDRLSKGDAATTLLVNSLATGIVLSIAILILAPLSGAHLNPAVTLLEAVSGRMTWSRTARYVTVQILGALAGVVLAHLMFDLPIDQVSRHARTGSGAWLSEFVATFGLFAVIRGAGDRSDGTRALAIGGYITAAYWFTASTSFANPAVTLARSVTDTFAGIRPIDVPGFVVVQLVGAAAATLLFSASGRRP